MTASSASRASVRRPNHSHGAPTLRNSSRYHSGSGVLIRSKVSGRSASGRGCAWASISRCVTTEAVCPAGTPCNPSSSIGFGLFLFRDHTFGQIAGNGKGAFDLVAILAPIAAHDDLVVAHFCQTFLVA